MQCFQILENNAKKILLFSYFCLVECGILYSTFVAIKQKLNVGHKIREMAVTKDYSHSQEFTIKWNVTIVICGVAFFVSLQHFIAPALY